MTYSEARAAIETLVAGAWIATPLAWDNTAFTPPVDGAPWARLAIEHDAAAQVSIGLTRRFRCRGRVLLSLWTAPGTGGGVAFRLADSAVALFDAASLPELRFGPGVPAVERDDDDGFVVTVTVPFSHDHDR